MSKADTINIGRITGAHATGGEVKFFAYGAHEDLAALVGSKLTKCFINEKPYTIKGARVHRLKVLLKLEGVSTRDEAEGLKGCEVSIPRDELPALEKGEYYFFELIGVRVRDEDGKELGTIANIFATGSNDVYEVRGQVGEILIPAIEGVVVGLDMAKKRMTVRLPEGLEPSGDFKPAECPAPKNAP